MKGTSPTARTLKVLREEGTLAQVVERWNPYAKVRVDLWGFVDILAIRGNETVGIQVTSASNHSARVKKIMDSPLSVKLILAGWILEVRSWGKKKGKWVERVQVIEIGDYPLITGN